MFYGVITVSNSGTSHGRVKTRGAALTVLILIAITVTVGSQQSVSTAKDLIELQNDPVPYINDVLCFLQANIRSLHTSRSLLELTTSTRRTEVMLLQEIWSEKGNMNMRDFLPPLINQRENREGGGVAIYVHKTAKVVHLHEYDVKGLEAIWAEVMIGEVRVVVGSVYIPPGQFDQMILLREQLKKICSGNPRVVLGMDANARSVLWDDDVRADSSRATKRMGELLVDILLDNGLEILGSVNRTKLIYKLVNNFGISGRLLLYLVSFLSGRQARINVNDLIGEWVKSERGTSAGTVLGALLFLLYVQDTPRCIRPKFADDLVGSVVAKDVATV